ncbi:unnamed protein product, partial [Miscanthus lutarioriparius]
MTLAILAVTGSAGSLSSTHSSPRTTGASTTGVATRDRLWLIDYHPDAPPLPEGATRKYRLAFLDFVHAALSAAVFGVVAAMDRDAVACLCGPALARETQELINVLPL